MANKKQEYLQWHGQQWRVRVKVPPALWSVIGKRMLIKPLHTSDLEKANDLKWSIVAAMKGVILAAKKGGASGNPMEAEALRFRTALAARGDNLQPSPSGQSVYAHEIDPDDILYDDLTDEITHRAYEIEKQAGGATAKRFADLAFGRETPLFAHLEDYVAFKAYPMKTGDTLRRGLRWLSEWQGQNHKPQSINAVTVREAAKFISGALLIGRGHETAQLHMTLLRGYWDWLIERQYVTSNPWRQSLPARPKASRDAEDDRGKRPYTDDEIATLIYGKADKTLSDLMHIAALSGMRIEEICQLRVKDCLEGQFTVRDGKTVNAKRTIPVHSALKGIIAKRMKGASQEAFLFSELPLLPASRSTRSDPIGKRFGRYRRNMGVDERPNGKLKSNVDFHSFRRWFSRKARDRMLEDGAGFDLWTIIAIMGHSDKDKPQGEMTMSTYAGTDNMAQKRRCIEAIKLPKPKGPTK